MDKKIRKKEKQPLVSVIMAAHNAEKYIAEAVESVINQTYKNWELIIVDDASSDSTSTIIERCMKRDSRIKGIHLEKNSGQAFAQNKAIEMSSAEYIATLDSDDVAMPHRIAAQVEFLEYNTDIDMVGSYAELIDEDGNVIGKKKKPTKNEEIRFPLLLQTQFIHPSICIRKNVLIDVGCYSMNSLYTEDYDLWSRLLARGCKFANIDGPLIRYRVHPESITQAKKSRSIGTRNALKTNARNVARFIDIPEEKLRNLVNFVNNKPLSLFELISALWWYHRLAKNYIASDVCTEAETSHIKKLYRTMRTHGIKTKVKMILHLS